MAYDDKEPTVRVGDYVLATKYSDGDPGDPWAFGRLHEIVNIPGLGYKYVILRKDGTPYRYGGFGCCRRVTPEQTAYLQANMDKIEYSGKSMWKWVKETPAPPWIAHLSTTSSASSSTPSPSSASSSALPSNDPLVKYADSQPPPPPPLFCSTVLTSRLAFATETAPMRYVLATQQEGDSRTVVECERSVEQYDGRKRRRPAGPKWEVTNVVITKRRRIVDSPKARLDRIVRAQLRVITRGCSEAICTDEWLLVASLRQLKAHHDLPRGEHPEQCQCRTGRDSSALCCTDVLFVIFTHLPFFNVQVVAKVCRQWHTAAVQCLRHWRGIVFRPYQRDLREQTNTRPWLDKYLPYGTSGKASMIAKRSYPLPCTNARATYVDSPVVATTVRCVVGWFTSAERLLLEKEDGHPEELTPEERERLKGPRFASVTFCKYLGPEHNVCTIKRESDRWDQTLSQYLEKLLLTIVEERQTTRARALLAAHHTYFTQPVMGGFYALWAPYAAVADKVLRAREWASLKDGRRPLSNDKARAMAKWEAVCQQSLDELRAVIQWWQD